MPTFIHKWNMGRLSESETTYLHFTSSTGVAVLYTKLHLNTDSANALGNNTAGN